MGTYQGYVRCTRCGTTSAEAGAYILCARCQADGITVYPRPVYDLVDAQLPTLGEGGAGVFRFASLLPVWPDAISLGEGNTPLIPLTRTAARLGVGTVWLKDESRNPTWSYKDRLAAVAVNKAAQQGADTVVVSSTGNHGAAIAAYAARLGLHCVVLTLASVPLAMKVLMQSFGAQVVAFAEPQDRWAVMGAGVRERGWVPMSGYVNPPSGSNPFGVDGYKTIAYELWEQLGGIPDVVVAPVAYGDGIEGIVRGFSDLVALGLAQRLPRIVAAEPYGAYSSALAGAGAPSATSVPTVAFSIAATTPTWQGLDAIRRTAGAAATADNQQIMAAQASLASQEGLFMEPSSAIACAVLPELIARGTIGADDRVVLLGTSTGLKDIDATAALLPSVPVIEPTLAAFDDAVA